MTESTASSQSRHKGAPVDSRTAEGAVPGPPVFGEHPGSGITRTTSDMADHERADEELAGQERWFHALVGSSSDLIAVLDDKARVLYANPAAERMLGLVPSEQVGRNMLALVHPDDLDETLTTFFEGAFRPGVQSSATFRFRSASGEWRVLEVMATNCLDDPAIAGVVFNVRDVTERTNLARALRTLGQANQVLVHAIDEAALLADTCRTIVDAGGYLLAWVGYVEHEPVHTVRPVASAGQSEYLESVQASLGSDDFWRGPMANAIRTQVVQVLHDLGRAPQFAPWQEAAAEHGFRTACVLPIEIRDEVVGALAIYAAEPGAFEEPEVALMCQLADDLAYGIERIRDAHRLVERTEALDVSLADLRAAQDKLVRGERLSALGEMASVVGHELRNPLSAVTNAHFLLRKGIGEGTSADLLYTHLEIAERETSKAAALAEDLTAFVRPRQPVVAEVDLADVVDEVIQATPPPEEVHLVVETSPLSMVADRGQLAEVLTNLVANAYQAVSDGGSVRVRAGKSGAGALVVVEDSGPGIDPAMSERVFEPFFTTKSAGTGLGLAICRRLVEAHGGEISIENCLDRGARVTVRIPTDGSASAGSEA